MNAKTVATEIPAAWLQPFPKGYKIPLWRWLLLPAAAIILHRSKGVWVSGELSLQGADLCFARTAMTGKSKAGTPLWRVPLSAISQATMKSGFVSEAIEIVHTGGTIKIMSMRSADFVALISRKAAEARQDAAEDRGTPEAP